jgi:hypothetical protein
MISFNCEFVRKCCYCGKIEDAEGWNYSADYEDSVFTHTCCPECEKEVLIELGLSELPEIALT